MASTNGISDFFAQIIVGGTITFIKTRLWFWNISISDELVYKTYYEFKQWMVRHNVDDIIDRDQFIDIMVKVLKAVEGGVDEELIKDPEFIEKTLKKHSWLWLIYSIFRDYVTSENVNKVADSPITKAVDRYLNKVMIAKPNLLDYKVKRDVDFAIEDYNNEIESESEDFDPVFTETLHGDTILGGEMNISAPWQPEPESNEQ